MIKIGSSSLFRSASKEPLGLSPGARESFLQQLYWKQYIGNLSAKLGSVYILLGFCKIVLFKIVFLGQNVLSLVVTQAQLVLVAFVAVTLGALELVHIDFIVFFVLPIQLDGRTGITSCRPTADVTPASTSSMCAVAELFW